MISARCVACDLHTIAPGLLERVCWRQLAAQGGDCEKSRIAPVNAIIIIIIINEQVFAVEGSRTVIPELNVVLTRRLRLFF